VDASAGTNFNLNITLPDGSEPPNFDGQVIGYYADPDSPNYTIPKGQSSCIIGIDDLADYGETISGGYTVNLTSPNSSLSTSSIDFAGTATTTLPSTANQTIANQSLAGKLINATEYQLLSGHTFTVNASSGVNLIYDDINGGGFNFEVQPHVDAIVAVS
jgi:hypothetical protein